MTVGNRRPSQEPQPPRQPFSQNSYSYLLIGPSAILKHRLRPQCRHDEASIPCSEATHKINTHSPFRSPAIASTLPQNARPLHPPPRHSIQVPLPLHSRPLHRSRLRHPSSRRSPFNNRSKRTLLRPLRLAYIPLLHSVESIFAYYQGKICSSSNGICEARVAERARGAEGCTGCGVELETGGFECGGGFVGD